MLALFRVKVFHYPAVRMAELRAGTNARAAIDQEAARCGKLWSKHHG